MFQCFSVSLKQNACLGFVRGFCAGPNKGSFFPQSIRDWNALPDSLISAAEDAEDCVTKFTSLVRVRD